MSTTTTIKRKKGPSEKSKPQPVLDGDHRKRSRNRCIRSCINCHASKRMCDRKRPACARCTQLGLTGLCVYEVDDPNQRSSTQDESSRLLERVAELEGVIRELKNKPHPRWIFSTCSEHSDDASNVPNSPSSSLPSPDIQVQGASSSQVPSVEESYLTLTPALSTSPPSSPSSSANTPPGDSSSPHAMINDDPTGLRDLDIFAQSLPFLGYSEDNLVMHQQFTGLGAVKTPYSVGQPCNCVLEPSNYHTMLELSLRLRKAAALLARSPHHQVGGHCLLNQRLSELDALTTNTLSLVDSPQFSYSAHQALHPPTVHPSIYTSAITASRLDTWLSGAIADSNNTGNDSLMSWDPPRRPQ
ncbi:uncharacterized protein C8R40DRAFT_305037 [Lentinula edodes]|uniref:uncharacterized protein n=1 Tax=Lentinula edodes TaxID=5353 RepID=UPI001E8E605E|nr:uncharacterized protein C8R40DRAFT_305037 [Lentinula edodes]KAH7874759.1 hypothetical protein C8R40DRAFT_305037 [Lentinula edodes]